MSPARRPPLRSLRSRALPAWMCALVAVIVALVLVRAPALAAVAADLPAAALAHGAAATDAGAATADVTHDDDNGDDAVDPPHPAGFLRGNGAPLVSTAPRADAVGLDPPRVPPPEA